MDGSLTVQVVQKWNKEDVEEWLNQNEFDEDVRLALHDARVDGPTLLRLDDLALQSIGVHKLGDRKRLLRLTRRIHNSCCFLDQDPRTWDVSDVGTWLTICGLGDYRESFSAATVTGRLLLSLDDWELRQIGVKKLGHRKQILRRASEAKLRPKRRLAAYPLPTQWTMLEVCDWLKVVQLDQYRQLFFSNCVAGEQLMKLTDIALSEMGIVSLGHRKRLLKEIASVKPDPKLLDPEMQSSTPFRLFTILCQESTSVVELRKQRQVEAMLGVRNVLT